jgi:hypothetical protein
MNDAVGFSRVSWGEPLGRWAVHGFEPAANMDFCDYDKQRFRA